MTSLYYTAYVEQLEQLLQAEQNAFINHADLQAIAIFDDICELKKRMITDYVNTLSSGTVAEIIGCSRYRDIDNAINKTVLYICETATEEELHDIRTDPEGIADTIRQCYKRKDVYQ